MTLQEIIDDLVDIEPFAQAFGVSSRTVRRWMLEPDGLPFVKVGRKPKIRPSSAAAWLQRRERQHNPPRRVGRNIKHAST